jgi:hypothetical protein
MTVIVATRDRMVSDSRLSFGDTHYNVGKIFRLPDGGLLATAGDGRLTYPFEKAFLAGEEPEPIEAEDDEDFEGVILSPEGVLTLYDKAYSPNPVGNPHIVIGGGQATGAALSWLKHNATPEEAVARAIEVDTSCGSPVVTVMLHEAAKPKAKRGK